MNRNDINSPKIKFHNPMNQKLVLNRIKKEYEEIKKNPLEGIGIEQIELHCFVINMRLLTGPYEGYCLQLLLIISQNYPTEAPKILIFPNQAFSHQYHMSIYDDERVDENNLKFKKICAELPDNHLLGWKHSYSLSSFLVQIQNFLSDPHMDNEHLPNENLIKQLFNSMNNYEIRFEVKDGEEIIHTWKNPYPQMYFKSKEKNEEASSYKDNVDIEEKRLQRLKEDLTCSISKVNYKDDPNLLFGYPIKFSRFPIHELEPELVSYDGFQTLNSQVDDELYWLPIYINKDHYEKNKHILLKTIAKLSEKDEFNPEQIFQLFPQLLVSFSYKSLSSNVIKCFFHIILLFKKLCKEYQVDYFNYLNKIYKNQFENKPSKDKLFIADIEPPTPSAFDGADKNNTTIRKLRNSLLEDLIIKKCKPHFSSKYFLKPYLLSDKKTLFYFEKLEKEPNYDMINLAKFNEDIHYKNIYNEIINIISTDKSYLERNSLGKEMVKEIVETRIKQSFKRLFLECSQEGKDKLKEIISKHLLFQDYFKPIWTKYDILFDILFHTNNIDKLLRELNDSPKKKEFIENFFSYGDFGKEILISTVLAQKKFEEIGFMEQLEKDYGVYLDVENFIKEVKQKQSEIKTIKALLDFLGADFIKNEKDKTDKYKDDLELIIDMYKKALEKRHIKNENDSMISSLDEIVTNYRIRKKEREDNYRNRKNKNNNFIDKTRSQSRSRSRSRSREQSLNSQ